MRGANVCGTVPSVKVNGNAVAHMEFGAHVAIWLLHWRCRIRLNEKLLV